MLQRVISRSTHRFPLFGSLSFMASQGNSQKATFSSDGTRTIHEETNSSHTVRTGGCACGQIRYELYNHPMIVHCCHCTDCKRLTGSAFVLNAWTEETNLKITQGEEKIQVAELCGGSGKPHNVCFCPNCSTTLYSRYRPPMCVYVRIGTLDQPTSLKPDVHIWTRSKPDWLDLSSVGVPVYKEYYNNMADVWAPSSLKRFQMLMEEAKRRKNERKLTPPSNEI